MTANKQRDGRIDEDPDDEDDEETTTAKAMRKLLTKRDKNAAYDSDEEKNPYASSVRLSSTIHSTVTII